MGDLAARMTLVRCVDAQAGAQPQLQPPAPRQQLQLREALQQLRPEARLQPQRVLPPQQQVRRRDVVLPRCLSRFEAAGIVGRCQPARLDWR